MRRPEGEWALPLEPFPAREVTEGALCFHVLKSEFEEVGGLETQL